MAEVQVTATTKTDKPANPIRESLFATAYHVENLDFPEAMENLLKLQQARGGEAEPDNKPDNWVECSV
jgi:hypothetical protein